MGLEGGRGRPLKARLGQGYRRRRGGWGEGGGGEEARMRSSSARASRLFPAQNIFKNFDSQNELSSSARFEGCRDRGRRDHIAPL